jgi:hypothetical protein
MEKEESSVLRESLDGLRRVEDHRREGKKATKEARIRDVIQTIEMDEAADARQAALVAIAAAERSWPLVANQVKLKIL